MWFIVRDERRCDGPKGARPFGVAVKVTRIGRTVL